MHETTCGITSKAEGSWRQVNLQEEEFDLSRDIRDYGVSL
jgi:hypothetical protein